MLWQAGGRDIQPEANLAGRAAENQKNRIWRVFIGDLYIVANSVVNHNM